MIVAKKPASEPMNQTNTDYVFQVIAPPADRSTSAARSSDDSPGFSDHLSYASTSVFDVLHQPARSDTANRTQRQEEAASKQSRERDSERRPEPRPANTSSSSSGTSNSANSSANASDTCDGAESTDRAADDDRVDDETTNGEVAAGVDGASHEAAKQAAAKTDESHQAPHDGTTQAKDKTEADAAKKAAGRKSAAAEVQNTGINAQLDEAADVNNGDAAAAATDAEQANTSSKDASSESAGKGRHGSDTDIDDALSVQIESNVAETGEAVQLAGVTTASSELDAAAGANEKKSALKSEADDDSSDGDSRQSGSSTDRGNTAAAKVDAAPIVAAVAADIADSAKDGGVSKGDGDTSTQPVSAKSETAVGPLARAMRATSEITRGGRSSSTNEAPAVDPARFVGRVAKAFETANERGGTLQLRLSPPELGALKIQLTVKDGVMSAALETDNANARRLLLDHLPALRDRLAEQNIRVDRFDVEVRQETSGEQADPRGFQQKPYQQQTERSETRRGNAAQQRVAEAAAPIQPAVLPQIGSDGINLVI